MHRPALLALLGVGLALALPEPAMHHNTTPDPCHLQVIPDYDFYFAYRAVLQLSPECPWGAVLRVRKSSTLNVVRQGAPYQPINPPVGAWDFGWAATTVPGKDLWTSSSWRWEWYDKNLWSERLQRYGRWVAAEVLSAQP